MGYSPLKNIVELKKKGIILSEKEFYQELSKMSNYMDEDSVRVVYSGLVRLVTKQLRDKGVCRLPHLGDFVIVPEKPQKRLYGNVRKYVDGLIALRFYPKYTWRRYFEYKKDSIKKPWYDGTKD